MSELGSAAFRLITLATNNAKTIPRRAERQNLACNVSATVSGCGACLNRLDNRHPRQRKHAGERLSQLAWWGGGVMRRPTTAG